MRFVITTLTVGDQIYELKLYNHSLKSCCSESLWDVYGETHLYEKAHEVVIRGALIMLFEDKDLKHAIISNDGH